MKTDSIPAYLKSRPQWVLWSWRLRGQKKTKVPLKPNGGPARSNRSSSWNSFERCMKALMDGGFDGIGFCFAKGDGLVGIDLDHCFEPDALNVLKPWASEIVFRFDDTYQERTPSGDGLHIICRGDWSDGEMRRRNKGIRNKGIEVYDYRSPRFFTMTGDKLNSYDIESLQEDLDWLHAKEIYVEPPVQLPRPRPLTTHHTEERKVKQALNNISPDDYETWIKVGLALKCGGMGLDMWDWWSAKSQKWEAGVCAKKWKTFSSAGKTGLGTIFYLARNTNAETA